MPASRCNALVAGRGGRHPGRDGDGPVPEDPAHVEPVEQMAEAALALCTVGADRITGRVVTSAAVLGRARTARSAPSTAATRSLTRVGAPDRPTRGIVRWVSTRGTRSSGRTRTTAAVAAEAGASGDWDPWADLFTEDAEYFEHLYGTFQGREAIRTWITHHDGRVPLNSEMTDFPADWWVIDEERGWVVCAVWNRMQDLGDGELHQAINWSLLKYAGNNQWSYEEDIYNVERVRRHDQGLPRRAEGSRESDASGLDVLAVEPPPRDPAEHDHVRDLQQDAAPHVVGERVAGEEVAPRVVVVDGQPVADRAERRDLAEDRARRCRGRPRRRSRRPRSPSSSRA